MGDRSPRSRLQQGGKTAIGIGNSSATSTAGNYTAAGNSLANASADSSIGKAVSFLSSDTVRWMNKRQPTNKSTIKHVLPSRALQLREIFRGLDYDNSGSIDIEEMKQAVHYVAHATCSNGDGPLFKDPAKLVNFFVAMDVNNDGTVDFDEFLAGMTSQASQDATDQDRLQQAFFEFANQHRRQRIMDFVQEQNRSDVEKYQELKHLFSIQYFKDEHVDLSMDEKLSRVQAQADSQMKELRSEAFVRQRRSEKHRAREAALYFIDQKQKRETAAAGPKKVRTVSFLHSIPELYSHHEAESHEAAIIAHRVDKKLRKKFAMFALHDAHTFAPDELSEGLNPQSIRKVAKVEAAAAKQDKYLARNIPIILPPVSVRDRVAVVSAGL
jgi:Ca2+-binding EF-hand superfamily protein